MTSNLIFGNFDMYSRRIGFFYNNHEKIGSYLGLFLTVIYIFASIILFIYQIINTIKRTELKVYDTTIYAQEMPSIEVNLDQLYFAFALEDPLTSNRFIDEGIYIAKVAFIEKEKINDEFITVNTTNLPIERCNVENFGKNYQHLFAKDELSNSYCLKDFNYTLTFEGGYKYERFTYIRLRIYPCSNSTSKKPCKPQEEIDRYLTSGYFSIVIKDFGLNPSNYTFPVLPTFQDLYTTIDKRIYRNYILNFGVTEIRTDTGLLEEDLKVDRYFQYRKEIQTFSFRDEKDYYAGKSVILVQLRLDDTILVQTRTYTRISEIFSRIGGYMQLMNTVFLLISSLINKLNSELKIINSIFSFNFKENKMILKLQSLKDSNLLLNLKSKKNFSLRQKTSIEDLKHVDSDNKSKNNLIVKDNDYLNISSLNISDIKKNNEIHNNQNNVLKINHNHNKHMTLEDSKISNSKSLNDKNKIIENPMVIFKENIQKNILDIYNKEHKECNDIISLNIFDYICLRKKSKKYKYIELYKKGNLFYKKKMDITHVFTLLSIIEDFVVK
jgi:hypothetical protein